MNESNSQNPNQETRQQNAKEVIEELLQEMIDRIHFENMPRSQRISHEIRTQSQQILRKIKKITDRLPF